MIKLKLVLALFLVSLFVISCNPDDVVNENYTSNGFAKNFGSEVSRDFIGQIVDVNKAPIENVTVAIGSKTVLTDVNGVFIINDAKIFEKFAHIKATKSGFIDGSRSMVPTLGKNNVRIMLISNANTQTIQSGISSEITLPNGTKVKFDGSFEDSFGRNYSGSIGVSVFHLAPSNENISSLMPGMLYAEDKKGDEKGLETFGMLHVGLTGSGGQKLQIASGHKAEISVQIDDSQVATAPNTIPLWHFDEINGYWKEDGMATRQGNKYVGNVSHFSWWNCDTFNSVVTLTLTIVDSNGNPISNLGTGLTVSSTNFNSYTQYTNNNGWVSGLIPANESITLKIYDGCNNIIYTSSIGPFSSDTVLPNIQLNFTQNPPVSITGHLLQCNGTNVTNGYVLFKNGNITRFTPVVNGIFNFDFTCNSIINFTLKGFDYDNQEQTNTTNFILTGNNIDVGNLMSCTAINEFVSLQIDNNPTLIFREGIDQLQLMVITTGNGYTLFVGNGTLIKLRIRANATTLGTFTTSSYRIDGDQVRSYDITSPTITFPNTLAFNLINYGDIGDYVDLNVDGTITLPNGNIQTVHIVAHVLRYT